jgi:CHAD domain-containing protein
MDASTDRIDAYACERIASQLKHIVELQADVLEDRDPEPLHHLRVSLRRLRCILLQFEPFLELPNGASSRRVGRMCAKLGLVRDLDVLQELVGSSFAEMLGPGACEELARLRKGLSRERRRAAEEMKQSLRSTAYLRVIARLQRWLREPNTRPAASMPSQAWIDELIMPWLPPLWLHPSWTLDPLEHPRELHSLRGRIRRCRYMIENLEPICSAPLSAHVQRFKTLQDILGELHDLNVFDTLIQDTRINLSGRQTKAVLQLSHQRQERLAAQWRLQSRRMLRSSQRKVLIRRLTTPR